MTAQSATPTLKRSIGTRTATALVVGNMVGSGVFLLPAALASEAGPISILGSSTNASRLVRKPIRARFSSRSTLRA